MQPRDDAHLRELYDAEMAELDAQVDRFLGGLELEGGHTAVLMSADHGEAFGEGGRYEHNDILEPQVHIPFLVRPAGARPGTGRRVAAPVSGVDVAPTLLGLAGLAAPAHYLGLDALALAEGRVPPQRPILVEDRDQMQVQDVSLALYLDSWKLVRRGLGEQQRFLLYDLSKDPVGLQDVAAQHPEVVARLRQELDGLRARWRADDAADQRGTGFRNANAEAMKALGYTGD